MLEAAEEHAADAHPDLELDEEAVETVKENIEAVRLCSAREGHRYCSAVTKTRAMPTMPNPTAYANAAA